MDKLKILVIDDKEVIGDLFKFTLGYKGHEIKVVDNAASALESIKKNFYDIIFLDIVMPGKDGCEILKEIRDFSPSIPVVMMTGYSLDEKQKSAERMGAALCLRKPFEMDDVKRVIKQTIGKDV